MDMSNAINSKVCIVLSGQFGPSQYGYKVFIVDLGSGVDNGGDETTVLPMSPVVQFDWDAFNFPAICVLRSKVYIFEDYHERYDPAEVYVGGKTVYTYDLSAGVGVKLDKSITLKEPAMKTNKVFPKATVTYHGKILVFSSLIQIDHADQFDFEMYDPVGREWYDLPNLPVCQSGDYSFHIKSFTFIDKSVFFLSTEVGVFALDLRRNDWVWERSWFRGDRFLPPNLALVVERDICVIPPHAFDIGCVGQADGENLFKQVCYAFPKLSPFSRSRSHSSESVAITLLEEEDDDDEVFTICFLYTGISKKSKLPELLLQVYKTHVPTCKKLLSMYREKKLGEDPNWWKRKRELFELPGTSKVKSLNIVVSEKSSEFNLCSFAPILY